MEIAKEGVKEESDYEANNDVSCLLFLNHTVENHGKALPHKVKDDAACGQEVTELKDRCD